MAGEKVFCFNTRLKPQSVLAGGYSPFLGLGRMHIDEDRVAIGTRLLHQAVELSAAGFRPRNVRFLLFDRQCHQAENADRSELRIRISIGIGFDPKRRAVVAHHFVRGVAERSS